MIRIEPSGRTARFSTTVPMGNSYMRSVGYRAVQRCVVARRRVRINIFER